MQEKIIHRLFKYLECKKIPHTRFEKEIGVSNGYLNTQLKRDADLGETNIRKVIDYCLDINPLWLLTGRGEMIKTAESGSPTAELVYKSDLKDVEIISSKNEIIETQKKLISSLEQRIKDLEHGSSHVKVEAFPSAHSVASTGGTLQVKTTK